MRIVSNWLVKDTESIIYILRIFFSFFPEAPPSYDSIFGRVKAAKAESNSSLDFLKKFLIIVVGTSKFTFIAYVYVNDPTNGHILRPTLNFHMIQFLQNALYQPSSVL